MISKNMIGRVLKRTTAEERRIDLLYMCVTATLIAMDLEVAEKSVQKGEHSIRHGLGPMFQGIRRILCPHPDSVKDRVYIKYMLRARLEYRGIASDVEMQARFHDQIRALATAGNLESREVAIEKQIWRQLGMDPIGSAEIEMPPEEPVPETPPEDAGVGDTAPESPAADGPSPGDDAQAPSPDLLKKKLSPTTLTLKKPVPEDKAMDSLPETPAPESPDVEETARDGPTETPPENPAPEPDPEPDPASMASDAAPEEPPSDTPAGGDTRAKKPSTLSLKFSKPSSGQSGDP